MSFMDMKQHYKSEIGISTSYVQVLPRRLTIDSNYVARRFSKCIATLFKEVNVVPFSELISPQMEAIFNDKPRCHECMADLLMELRVRLKEVILENWSSTRDHVMLHSSGLDSRLISWTIKQIHKERGDGWLGNIIFLCTKREAQEFRNIMQYEGWNDNQYWVPREDIPMPEYYAPSLLDFQDAWKRADGCSAIPINMYWYPIQLAQEAGLTSQDIQLWTGNRGNGIYDYGSGPDGGETLRKLTVRNYWSIFCTRPLKSEEVIYPHTDYKSVQTVVSSRIRPGKRLKPLLLKSIDEDLAKFANMMADGDRHVKIADRIVDKMVEDYRNSWYGKNVAPDARPKYKTTEFQPFWSRWTAASLCEYLIEEGYTIERGVKK